MEIRPINAADAPAAAAAYSQAVEVTGATRTLYISGQVGIDAAGDTPTDAVEQNRLVWSNLVAQLRAAGMTLDNLVRTRRSSQTLPTCRRRVACGPSSSVTGAPEAR